MATLRTKLIAGHCGMLAFSLGALAALSLGYEKTTAVLIAGGIAYCVTFFLLVGRLMVHPLREMAASTRDILAGKRDRVPHERANDEVGELAQSINALAATDRQFRIADKTQLLRTQETARSVINSIPHAVALVSPDGSIEIANAAAATFRLDAGTRVAASAHVWLLPLVEEVRRTRTRAGSLDDAALLQIFEGGRELFYRPQANPVLDEKRELIGITVVLVDVTEERQIDEAKSGLISSVSHELKTPLTSIQMAIHLLLEDAAPRLTQRELELLLGARDDAERLNRLIEELLVSGREKK